MTKININPDNAVNLIKNPIRMNILSDGFFYGQSSVFPREIFLFLKIGKMIYRILENDIVVHVDLDSEYNKNNNIPTITEYKPISKVEIKILEYGS